MAPISSPVKLSWPTLQTGINLHQNWNATIVYLLFNNPLYIFSFSGSSPNYPTDPLVLSKESRIWTWISRRIWTWKSCRISTWKYLQVLWDGFDPWISSGISCNLILNHWSIKKLSLWNLCVLRSVVASRTIWSEVIWTIWFETIWSELFGQHNLRLSDLWSETQIIWFELHGPPALSRVDPAVLTFVYLLFINKLLRKQRFFISLKIVTISSDPALHDKNKLLMVSIYKFSTY